MKREGTFSQEKVILKSIADQEMSHAEFMEIYTQKMMELDGLDNQLLQLKEKLRPLSKIEETDEIKKIKEMLVTAELLKERDEIKAKVKKGELKRVGLAEEMNKLHPIAQKIRTQGKKNEKK